MLMLLFFSGPNCFALDCQPVVEVFPKVKLQKVPGQNKSQIEVAGLLNYGGKPIPVIDICQLIERRQSSDALHTRIVLIQLDENRCVALLAEKVIEVLDLDPSRFHDANIKLEGLPFLKGILNEGDRSIQFFDLKEFHKALQATLLF